MERSAAAVTGGQQGVHPRLREIVDRHARHPFVRPVSEHTQMAFDRADRWVRERDRPIVIDAGCGTGWSCHRLAARHADAVIVGIDRSEARLAREPAGADGHHVLRVRAELTDFWRLALDAGWRPAAHYLLYPNPYPKAGQLKRRWHAHPVFPTIVALGGTLELRTNWSVYAAEMQLALGMHGVAATGDVIDEPEGLSRFELKYARAGQPLFRLVARPGAADRITA